MGTKRAALARGGPLVVLVGLAALYTPVMLRMASVWWHDSYAGHGMFVPLFSAHFVWIDRARVRAALGARDTRGLLVILTGLLLLGLGRWERSLLVEGLSFVLTLTGVVLWLGGARAVRALAFPLAFMCLMVPLPRAFVAATTLHLQLFAARFSGYVLSLLDVPFLQRGVLIELPSMTLEVAEVCNGLRFLSALVVLTLAFAYVTQRTIARTAILTVMAVPVAIVANAVRVTGITLGVHYIGPQAASGFIHNYIGKGVWAITILTLVAIGVVLRRTTPPVPEPPAVLAGVGNPVIPAP
jgi:exosortase